MSRRTPGRPVVAGHRAARRGRWAVAVLLVAVLSGCTVSGRDEAAPSDAAGTSDVEDPTGPTGPTKNRPAATPSPDGPTPQELSEQLFAASAEDPEPLGSVTAPVGADAFETVLDVLEVRAVTGGTFVRFRMSTTGGSYNVAPTTFASDRFGTQSFVRDIYLDDPAGGTRYLPLQFEDYREACVCPYKPLEIGPEAQELHALFPALPDGVTTVDLSLADTDLLVTGLPVDG